MASILESILLITSKNPDIRTFGTGFVVHRDGDASYLLTCTHVVTDVGGPDQIRVADRAATLIASGETPLDLAVLRVDGILDWPPLRLETTGNTQDMFLTAGFQAFGKSYLLRPIRGSLGAAVELAASEYAGRVRAWDLEIVGDYRLQPGYSGSPVAHEGTAIAFGVVSHRFGEGERGVAISLEGLTRLWPRMPAGLLGARGTPPRGATYRPRLSEIRQRSLQLRLSARIEEYDALNRQLARERDAADELRIQRQIGDLEQEIEAIEHQLMHVVVPMSS